jgi:hypothetical protein
MKQAEWQTLYSAAIFERDLSKVRMRIHVAETAIFSRIQNLAQDSDSNLERESIANALSSLRALQRNLLRCPREGRQIA